MSTTARRAYSALPPAARRRVRNACARLPGSWQAAFRQRFVWPSSATAEMTLAYVQKNGLTVRRGPLEGLMYSPELIGHVDQLVPKLVGSYERELHEVLARLATPTVVNVGSGDGYYAVGLARQGIDVVAFDPDRRANATCARLAATNEVAVRITGSKASSNTLCGLENSLVICDCEGDENEVLNPEELRTCSLIVELHDFIRPGIGDELISRFRATHDVKTLQQEDRDPRKYPETDGLPHRHLALYEHRPETTRWAVMIPREHQGGRRRRASGRDRMDGGAGQGRESSSQPPQRR